MLLRELGIAALKTTLTRAMTAKSAITILQEFDLTPASTIRAHVQSSFQGVSHGNKTLETAGAHRLSASACSTLCPRPPLSVLAIVLRALRVACCCSCVGTSSDAAPPVPTTFMDCAPAASLPPAVVAPCNQCRHCIK